MLRRRMKTYVTYGLFLALGGLALNLVFYLLGYHSDPEKMQSVRYVAMAAFIIIAVVCLFLGMKARMNEVPPSEEFGYGRSFGSGVMISLFGALFSIVTVYLYVAVINPGYTDIVQQAQANAMEAKGLSSEQIERFQKMSAMWMKPGMQAAMAFVIGMVFNTVFSLIIAAFVKRPATQELAAEPPPIA